LLSATRGNVIHIAPIRSITNFFRDELESRKWAELDLDLEWWIFDLPGIGIGLGIVNF
jgi:hypothetical protein